MTYTKIFNSQSAGNLSKAIIEAVLVAVGKNSEYIDSLEPDQAGELFNQLKSDSQFSVESLKEGLSQKTKVINRIKKAIEIFSGN